MASLMDIVWDTAAHILSAFGFRFGGLLLFLGHLVTKFELANLPTDLLVDNFHLPEKYDYVIVGGGSAGCVLANRLSADQSKMVLLLEAGGMEDAFSQVPLFAPLLIGGKFDWKYLPEPQEYACLSMEHQRCPWARGMAMGGSSAINFMFYVRGNRRDYDIWRDDFGAHGWSYEDVLPHFRNIETSSVPDHDGPFSIPGSVEALAFVSTPYVNASLEFPDVEIVLQSLPSSAVPLEYYLTNMDLRKDVYDQYFLPKRGHHGFALAPVMNRPKSRGYVKLRTANPLDQPIIDPMYLTHPQDLAVAVEGRFEDEASQGAHFEHITDHFQDAASTRPRRVKIALRLMETDAMRALKAKPWDIPLDACYSAGPIWSDPYIACLVRHMAHTTWHACCTCPMGSDERAVVDHRLRVRGLKSLRVVDASVMPTIVTGNLNAPVMMIADKAAAMIRQDNA
ncbi:glucose dehydrogenase [FAD, quinone] [Dermacentor silvarum]|uniref:glucose dehydrogenase [FAD, quinone] n=1 Tax=Dermacentor silvarum TaxID=543639 RepID=UPI00189A6456|nr:glucose dehydrogenase [FAD, quinone] [Dermacentor silvarum]